MSGIPILYGKGLLYIADGFMQVLMVAKRHKLAEESSIQAFRIPHSSSIAINILFFRTKMLLDLLSTAVCLQRIKGVHWRVRYENKTACEADSFLESVLVEAD